MGCLFNIQTASEVIDASLSLGVEPIPGAFTPTEIRIAQRAGIQNMLCRLTDVLMS